MPRLTLSRLFLLGLSGAALTACSVAAPYTEQEQSIVDNLDGGLYQPASRQSRDSIETQTSFAQAAFWAREYQLNPGDLESAIKLSAALRKIGNPAKAAETAQLARAMHPRDPYLTAEFAAALIASERGDEAIKPLQDGLRAAPQYARLWSLMGAALDQGEQYAQARRHYQRALSITPNDPSILANMGLSYALEGDAPQAEGWLRRAAAIPGASKGVQQNLDLVLQLQGKTPPPSQTAERAEPVYPPSSIQPARAVKQTLSPNGAPQGYRNDMTFTKPSSTPPLRALAGQPSQQAAPQARQNGYAPQGQMPQASTNYSYSNSPSTSGTYGGRGASQSAPKTAMDAARAAAARSAGRKVVIPEGAAAPQSNVLDNIANNLGPRSATGAPASQVLAGQRRQRLPQQNTVPQNYAPTQLQGYGQPQTRPQYVPAPQQYQQQQTQYQQRQSQQPQSRGPARRR